MDLKEAAQQIGVHYQTAYQWVREGRLSAVKIGASYHVEPDAVERLIAERLTPTPPPTRAQVRDWESHRERLERLLLSGDEAGVRNQLDRLAEGRVPVVDICEQLISPVLVHIGERWADGELSIAEEHRSSAIIERALAAMMTNPPGRPRGTVIVTTPPGDEHALPATMATAVLRNNRWVTHHLGTQVPKLDVLKLAKDVNADLVILTVTNPVALPSADEVADHLTTNGVTVLVGGPGKTLRDLTDLADSAVRPRSPEQ
jgi:excisionase family DNA binding protein